MAENSLRQWFGRWFGSADRVDVKQTRSRRPALEALEDRLAPAMVTTLLDNVPGSLRAAIAAGGTVQFAPGLSGTITLTAGQIAITKSVVIDGPGANLISINAHGASRIFDVANANLTVSISGLSLTGGKASIGNGGAIDSGNDILNLNGLAISGSSAAGNGGAISIDAGPGQLTVTNTTISGNTASGNGGGIALLASAGGTTTLINDTIANNKTSGSGGGVYSNAGTLNINDTTIAGNVADFNKPKGTSHGGGVEIDGGSAALVNTIVANNVDAGNQAPDVYNNDGVLTVNYSLIGNAIGANVTSGSHDVEGQNPLLGPLENNGGTVRTMALLTGSPAIDAGNNSLIPAGVFADQRGTDFARVFNGIVDLGAFESQFLPTQTRVTASTASVVVGQPVTLDATVVSSAPGSPPVSGVVVFLDNGVLLGVVTLNSAGHANLTTSGLVLGSNKIEVVYAPLASNTNEFFSSIASTAVTGTVVTSVPARQGRIF